MSDSIKNILKNIPNEPPQVRALKQYVKDNHNTQIKVRSSPRNYLIEVPGGAIAHKLREESAEITELCKLDKPLVIHISY